MLAHPYLWLGMNTELRLKSNGWHNLQARFRLAGIGAAVAFSSHPKSI